MSTDQSVVEIQYPESDGKPIGESDLHRDWMFRIIEILLLAPDVFSVKDCSPSQRRVYKLWDEKRIPNVVFEVTSKSTKREDAKTKPKPNKFATIGIEEYFYYDPQGEYVSPPLQGDVETGKVQLPRTEASDLREQAAEVVAANARQQLLELQQRLRDANIDPDNL